LCGFQDGLPGRAATLAVESLFLSQVELREMDGRWCELQNGLPGQAETLPVELLSLPRVEWPQMDGWCGFQDGSWK